MVVYRNQGPGNSSAIDQVRERMTNLWTDPLTDARVSVVIPVWGTGPHTLSCLAAVTKYSSCMEQLIVVAQELSPEDEESIGQVSDDRLLLLRQRDAVGFARASNLGLEAARGDFVAFIHSDVVVTPRWDAFLLRPLFAATDIALAGPVASHSGNATQMVQAPEIHSEQELVQVSGQWMQQLQGHWREVEALDSFCLMGRRSELQAVAGWREAYPWGVSADLDLSYRMRHRGRRLVVAGDLLLHHQGGVTFQEHRLALAAIQAENRKLLEAMWGRRQD